MSAIYGATENGNSVIKWCNVM